MPLIRVIGIVTLASLTAFAADLAPVETQADGTAAGLGPAARGAAIRNAQANIVVNRLEILAPTRDFSLFASIVENPERYVPAYRVIREDTTDNATTVEIAGEVLDAKLRRDAAKRILESHAQKPRVILMVDERIAPDEPRALKDKGVAEDAIAEKLRDAKFDVVDSRELLAKNSEADLRQFLGGSPGLLSELARTHLADIVIVGNASALLEGGADGKSGLHRLHAKVDLRVIRAADAYELDDVKTEAVLFSADVREGGALCVTDACDKAAPALVDAAALGMLGGTPQDKVYLTIEGLEGKAQLDQILATIQAVPGVDSVDQMYTSDVMVRLAVAYSGSMTPFVDALSRGKYDGRYLHIRSVVNRDMTVQIRR